MQYKIEQIGAEFSDKAIQQLEANLTQRGQEGYRFHSVFQVQKPGCMGIGAPSVTYLAVFVKNEQS